ncbi:MAG: hypothetical protein ACRDH2_18850 [Anaerolineales bacterium]
MVTQCVSAQVGNEVAVQVGVKGVAVGRNVGVLVGAATVGVCEGVAVAVGCGVLAGGSESAGESLEGGAVFSGALKIEATPVTGLPLVITTSANVAVRRSSAQASWVGEYVVRNTYQRPVP